MEAYVAVLAEIMQLIKLHLQLQQSLKEVYCFVVRQRQIRVLLLLKELPDLRMASLDTSCSEAHGKSVVYKLTYVPIPRASYPSRMMVRIGIESGTQSMRPDSSFRGTTP